MRLPAKVIDAKANLLLKKISAGGMRKGAFEKIIPAMNGGGIEDFTLTSLRYGGTNPPHPRACVLKGGELNPNGIKIIRKSMAR